MFAGRVLGAGAGSTRYTFEDEEGEAGSSGDEGRAAGQPLLDIHAGEPYDMSDQEVLSDNAMMSRKLSFRFAKYFSRGWGTFSYNASTYVIAAVIWVVLLGAVEMLLYAAFGHVNGDNVWFFRTIFDEEEQLLGVGAKPAAAPAGHGPGDIHKYVTRHHWRLLSVACLCLSRVLVFYPLLGSAYVATFNAARRSTQLVHLGDFFACFRTDRLPRFALLGSCCFGANFLLVYLIPETALPAFPEASLLFYTVYYVFTFFSVPVFAEYEHLSVADSFRFSAFVVNGRFLVVSLFALTLLLIQLAGISLFGVGALLALPLTLTVKCACYDHLLRVRDTTWRWAHV